MCVFEDVSISLDISTSIMSSPRSCMAETSTAMITSSGGVDANPCPRATKWDLISSPFRVDPLRADWRLPSAAPAILRGGILTELSLMNSVSSWQAVLTSLASMNSPLRSSVAQSPSVGGDCAARSAKQRSCSGSPV